jgi:hypothetical protein
MFLFPPFFPLLKIFLFTRFKVERMGVTVFTFSFAKYFSGLNRLSWKAPLCFKIKNPPRRALDYFNNNIFFNCINL